MTGLLKRQAALLGILAVLWLGGDTRLGAEPWQGFTSLVLSSDGRFFATGGREGEVVWWETSTGESLSRWVKSGGGPVVALAFSPDARQLAVSLLDGSFWVGSWEDDHLEPLSTSAAPSKDLALARSRWITSGPLANGLRVNAGDLWAQGTPDGQMTVGKQSDGTILATWTAHQAAVTGLALADDGSFLLSCSYDGGLDRWDPQTGRLLGTLQSPHS